MAVFLSKTMALVMTQAQAAGALASTGIILVPKIVPAQEITEHPSSSLPPWTGAQGLPPSHPMVQKSWRGQQAILSLFGVQSHRT